MQEYSTRRKDRVMPEADSLRLIQTERVGRLALADQEGQPYVIPLNHLLLDHTIYFHCALSGRKLDMLLENPKVCYEVDRFLGIKSGPTACEYGAFYESALVFGVARLVSDPLEKVRILNQLTAHHAAPGALFAPVTESTAAKVAVVAVSIDQVSGKARPIA